MKQKLLAFSEYIDKIAILAFAFPATYALAAARTSSPFWSPVLGIAGGVVVDAFFIAALLRLELHEDAPLAERMRNIAGAVFMYGIILAIANEQGEGITGLIFRAAIGWGVINISIGALLDWVAERREKRLQETPALRDESVERAAWRRVKRHAINRRVESWKTEIDLRHDALVAELNDASAARLDALDAMKEHRERVALQQVQEEVQKDAQLVHEIVKVDGGYAITCPYTLGGYAVSAATGGMIVHSDAATARKAKGGHEKSCKTNGNGGTKLLRKG